MHITAKQFWRTSPSRSAPRSSPAPSSAACPSWSFASSRP